MFRQGFRSALLFSLWVATGAAQAQAPFCNIDYVKRVGMDVELHFTPYNGLFVRIKKIGREVAPEDRMFEQVNGEMHRLYDNELQPEKTTSKVLLFDGEEALLGGDPHSGCTIQKAIEGGALGVEAKATVNFDGIPPQTTSRFFPAK